MKTRSAFKEPDTLQGAYKQANKGLIKVCFEDVYIQTEDEKFLAELVEYVKQNISNPNLSVVVLSRDMKMSRVWLYKKLLMLTGISPVVFIRAVRLQKAIQLLENTQLKISEIACEVGFETPQYFSRIFKTEYDLLPSAYASFARRAKGRLILDAYGLADTIKTAGLHNQNITNKAQKLI